MVDIQPATAEIRRGIKKEERKKPKGKNIMDCPIPYGGNNKCVCRLARRIPYHTALSNAATQCPPTLVSIDDEEHDPPIAPRANGS